MPKSRPPISANLKAKFWLNELIPFSGFLHPANLGVSNSSTQNLYDDDIDIKLFDILDSD